MQTNIYHTYISCIFLDYLENYVLLMVDFHQSSLLKHHLYTTNGPEFFHSHYTSQFYHQHHLSSRYIQTCELSATVISLIRNLLSFYSLLVPCFSFNLLVVCLEMHNKCLDGIVTSFSTDLICMWKRIPPEKKSQFAEMQNTVLLKTYLHMYE